MKEKSNVHKLVDHFFELKGWDDMPKSFYIEHNISYGRCCAAAKNLLDLCGGNLEEAKAKLAKVGKWADDLGLDWMIETVFRKWLELKTL